MDTPVSPICIAADHPCLAGHFPGQPVVPGVLLLDELLQRARACFGPLRLQRLPQIKFAAPLLPAQQAEVLFDPRGERLRFRVQRGEGLIASGELVFDHELTTP